MVPAANPVEILRVPMVGRHVIGIEFESLFVLQLQRRIAGP